MPTVICPNCKSIIITTGTKVVLTNVVVIRAGVTSMLDLEDAMYAEVESECELCHTTVVAMLPVKLR